MRGVLKEWIDDARHSTVLSMRAAVQDPNHEVTHAPISIKEAIGALVIVLLLELVAVICLFILMPPPPNSTNSILRLNSDEALKRPKECVAWDDLTDYGNDGLLLPGAFAVGEIHILKPVAGDYLRSATPELNCTAAEAQGKVADVQNYNNWQVTLGPYKNTCPGDGVRVFSTQGNLLLNCLQAYGHLQEVLRGQIQNASAPMTNMAVQCTANNEDALSGRNLLMTVTFRWSKQPYRIPLQLWVTILCSGADAVAELLGVSNVSEENQTAMESSAGLCTLYTPDGSQCIVTLVFRNLSTWGPAPEYMKVEVGVVNALDGPIYGVTVPDELANIYFQGGPGPYAEDVNSSYRVEGGLLDMDVSPIRGLAQATMIDPSGVLVFADMQYLTRSCPGRVTKLGDDMVQFTNSSGLLDDLVTAYERNTPFVFSCTVLEPPTFWQRCTFIWPTLSVIHVVALTFLVRYVYRCMVALTQRCSARSELPESEEVTSSSTVLPEREPSWCELADEEVLPGPTAPRRGPVTVGKPCTASSAPAG